MATKKINSKKIFAANWKMNPDTGREALEIFSGIKKFSKKYNTEIIVCPPFPFIALLGGKENGKISIGAQNVSSEKRGSFTGEVSASMLKSVGVSYVIVGHSERRALGENNEMINKKILQALSSGIKVIFCIGEKSRDHDGDFFNVIREEILQGLKKISKKQITKIIIAYEPLWAIGKESKGAMDPHSIAETIIFIRKILSDHFGKNSALKMKILYGGSVDPKNVFEQVSVGTADGVLVGRESLKPSHFEKILKEMSK